MLKLTNQEILKIRESINVNWNSLCYSFFLEEDFIREFKDKVNWSFISQNQKLSEGFIRDF